MKAIVVGAGIGGLSAALVLSNAGYTVEVLDRLPRAGGKIGVYEHGGVLWDTGPSVFTMRDVLGRLDAAAGTALLDRLTLVKHEQTFVYYFADGTELPIYFDVERSIESVENVFGAKEAKGFRKFLTYADKIWSAAAPNFVYGPAPTYGSAFLMGMSNPFAVKAIDPFRTMSGAIDSFVKTNEMRMLLKRFATYNGSDPRQAPATLNCIAHVELSMGCYGIDGGMYAMIDEILKVFDSRQIAFRPNTSVTAIEKRDGGFCVKTDGEDVFGDVVISNVDAAHLNADLLGKPEEKRQRSMSGWTALFSTPRRPDRIAHSVIFPENYDDEFAAIFDRGERPAKPTVYACAQTQAHNIAFENDVIFAMINAPSGCVTNDDAIEQLVRETLEAKDLLDPSAECFWRRSPTDLGTVFPGTDGAIYGASSNSQFDAFSRPKNRSKIPGLYLATGSAHPGGGVPMCMLSGLAASAAAIDDQNA